MFTMYILLCATLRYPNLTFRIFFPLKINDSERNRVCMGGGLSREFESDSAVQAQGRDMHSDLLPHAAAGRARVPRQGSRRTRQ